MIDNLFNLLFRCRHHRLTRPITPVDAEGSPEGDAYVVCLDCGKHFAYDAKQMKMGKAIRKPAASGISSPPARRSKLKRAAWISLPIGVVLGALLKRKRKNRGD
jgi:hypothetical protein